MTALAIMMLSHQGRLSIDDHVVKHLPVFRKWGEKVTIRHLLYHTSGLPDYYDDIEDEFSRPTNSQALQFLSSLGYLKFRPGAKFDYSNSGYDTLGALIQKVSGQRFGDFMNAHIFAPAGMTNSFAFDNSRRKASKRALGYALDRGKYSLDDTSPLNLMHGSGSIYASVEDLAKYDAALFGYQYLPKVVLDQSFVSGATNRGSSIGYGFGWELGNDNDINQPYYGHSGEWMGFSSYYLRYPTLSLSVIVLANCSDTDAEAIAFESAHAVLENR